MRKADLIILLFSKKERENIDTAIPIEFWETNDPRYHIMDYNNNSIFGELVNLKELAQLKNININD